MSMTKKLAALVSAVVIGTGAALAAPAVSDVRLAPRADSRTVDIYYKLTGDNAYITLAIETNALASPEWQGVKIADGLVTRLGGDVARLISADADNDKHIVWNAGEDWPDVEIGEARAVVTAWATNYPPPYLVFDLGGEHGGGDYFTLHKISAMGYPSAEALPHGGLTNDIYRGPLLVMRRIPAGAFMMGSPFGELGRNNNEHLHLVTISHAFYIGVFEFTKGQWRRIKNASPTPLPNNPADSESFVNLRGGTWPAEDDVISPSSFIGTLRGRCNQFFEFDLPTEAEWEYACRAGTQTSLHNGKNLTSTDVACPNRAEIAWDVFESGNTGHRRVGEKMPNAWGLYDMIGNVYEGTRDWMSDGLGSASAVDPVGPATGDTRVKKGGAFNGRLDPRAGYRGAYAQEGATGFRLAIRPLTGVPVSPQQ